MDATPAQQTPEPAPAGGPTPSAVVLRAPGTNCDGEMVRAFELAGARVSLVHVESLRKDPTPLERADLIGLPGGFSYGDDVASGRVLSARLRETLWEPMRAAAARGVPMIGVCNGFQVLVQLGLVPGDDGRPGAVAALGENRSARFIDRWVDVAVHPASPCVWLDGLDDAFALPVAHGEGRFILPDRGVLGAMERDGRACMRYAEDVNGSMNNIAGACDATGLIFGLMPHPDRFLEWSRDPMFTRLTPSVREAVPPGLAIFQNGIRAASRRAAATAAG